MAEGLTLSAMTEAFRSASSPKRAVWAGVVMLAAIVAGFLLWERQPDYRVLFANLSDRDGGAVVDALERLNIPYRLSDPTGAIEVPADQLHVARYKLAAQGLPKGDKRDAEPAGMTSFGLSQFQEQIGYQRALEDELAKSIAVIDGVASARVHLALPKQTSFLRERIPPAASALIKLQPAARFGEEQVESIRHIVASSVPGMTAAQVSVVDQSGILLAAGVAGLYRGLSPDQLEFTRRIESEYAARLFDMLSSALQASAYKVQVTAQIDFSESEETTENASQSGKAMVVSRKTTRHVKEPKGTIKRLAALVVVDEAAGLQKPQLEKIERLARQAIGFDSRRRDSVQVIMVPFATHASSEAANAAKPESLRNVDEKPAVTTMQHARTSADWPVYAGLALAVLAGVLLVWMLLRRGHSRSAEAALAPEESISPGERFETELGSIRQRVLEDPKVAASVVKQWMNA